MKKVSRMERTALTRIAFLLLAHKDPAAVAAQARMLTAKGDGVVIHFDAGARDDDWLALVEGMAGLPRVHLLRRRLRCGWGEWSLVAATLAMVQAALGTFPWATHLYLLSGDCRPLKPVHELRAYLAATGQDHIECADFFRSGWIKTGLREERVIFRHPFNERRQRRLFYLSLWGQRTLGLRRRLPAGLDIRIGSQWWCLRRETAEAVLALCRRRPRVRRFFRLSWVPDETFFQTLVSHLVPAAQIGPAPLTRVMFTDYGLPVVFHDDHAELLLGQEHGFFVRKVAPGAARLRQALSDRFLDPPGAPEPPRQPDLDKVLSWRARRGRHGRRSPPPPWERGLPAITVVLCKRWHVSARIAERVARATGRLPLGHVFDEARAGDPDMGGFAATPAERRADPAGYLRRAAETAGTAEVIVCLDPCRLDVLTALERHGARCLWLDAEDSRVFLEGHSRRIGLDGGLIEEVATELVAERVALERARPPDMTRINADDPTPVAAQRLARALDIDLPLASDLAQDLELTGG